MRFSNALKMLNTVRDLMYKRHLLINGHKFEIIEIEVYYNAPGHNDVTVHKTPEQAMFGKWYFHRSKPGGAYRGGTFKGLDLTLGSEGVYCGILIRGIHSDSTGPIVGPCRVVDFVLKSYGIGDLNEFVGSQILDASTNHRQFHLIPTETAILVDQLYIGPRIGLKDFAWKDVELRFARRYSGSPFKLKTTLRPLT